MKIYATRSTSHIIDHVPCDRGNITVKQFSDGELYVKVNDNVQNQEVIVISSTIPPTDNLLETYLLLDALSRNGAKVNLFFLYFGYARQDKAQPGEALSSWVVSKFVEQFAPNRIAILHPHNGNLKNFMSFKTIYPENLYKQLISDLEINTIVAPDHGISDLCEKVAKDNNCELIICDKKRPQQEQVTMNIKDGNAHQKRALIIDDIITTGNTIINAAQLIHEQAPANIYACITHGLFTNNAAEHIMQSNIERLFVTNTINGLQTEGNIEVIDIAPQITTSISECF